MDDNVREGRLSVYSELKRVWIDKSGYSSFLLTEKGAIYGEFDCKRRIRFQTFAMFWMLCSFFERFPGARILCSDVSEHSFGSIFIAKHRPWRWSWQSVPKRRHIIFRRRGIIQKKDYNMEYGVRIRCGWIVSNENTIDVEKYPMMLSCLVRSHALLQRLIGIFPTV